MIRPGRFDKLIYVPPPSLEDRAEMFRRNLQKAPLGDNVDFNELGKISKGYTGADIVSVCRQIKMEALENTITDGKEKKITTEDIAKMVSDTKPSAPAPSLSLYESFMAHHGRK